MARSLTASRLRRYVGGLAALSAARPGRAEQMPVPPRELSLIAETAPQDESESADSDATSEALARATELIGREDWARAQRFLEEVTHGSPDRELVAYLDEVRAVRRAQRRIIRRPRDATLHIELGRLYFGLELGDQAIRALTRAVELEPTSAEAHFYLALEHIFRGDEKSSRRHLARAATLRPDVPSYDKLLQLLYESAAS